MLCVMYDVKLMHNPVHCSKDHLVPILHEPHLLDLVEILLLSFLADHIIVKRGQ